MAIHVGKEYMTSEEMQQVNERYSWIEPLLEIPMDSKVGKYITIRVRELAERGVTVSRSRLYHLRNAFLLSGKDPASLLSKKSGSKKLSRIQEEVQNLIVTAFEKYVCTKHHRSVNDIYDRIQAEIHAINSLRSPEERMIMPSMATIYRRYKQFDAKLRAESKNERTLFSKHGMLDSYQTPTRPLQVVKLDHIHFDLLFIDDISGKVIAMCAWLTMLMDEFTDMPHGFNLSFKPPSYETVMLTLKHAILPKNVREKYPEVDHEWPVSGLPETIVTDNGIEFRSKRLKDAFDKLGIELKPNYIKRPWCKGVIERFYNRASQQISHQMFGIKWSSTKPRKNKFNNSIEGAAICYNDFLIVFHKWLLDYYCTAFHKELKDVPLNFWYQNESLRITKHDPTVEELDLILCPDH